MIQKDMQNLKNIIIFAIIALIIAGIGLFFFSPKRTATPSTTTTTTTDQTGNPQGGQPVQGQGSAPTTQTNDQTITLTSTGFTPTTLTVKTGTKVTWVNKSGSMGDVDSDPHPIHTSYPAMNFGTFSDGSTVSLVFNTAGTYHYHNHLNPSQTGTIIVQ